MNPETAVALAGDIRDVSGVAALHAGRFGEVALLFPRRRVNGLRRTSHGLEVHVVVDLTVRRPLIDVAVDVRHVVARHLDLPVDIIFAEATDG
ncbi:MAG: hypothetical protein Q4G50_13465 [Corynebacterium sp.]|uniref:hypothetical protein n=1 Tax=Corynebacterium sp. TaxID=1720 RepID=UPI0026DF68C0|nr:hypothetical protein [Corynebacterium sp.]MDO5670993.1 hypothetical protein [Corynebacterium sp.]